MKKWHMLIPSYVLVGGIAVATIFDLPGMVLPLLIFVLVLCVIAAIFVRFLS